MKQYMKANDNNNLSDPTEKLFAELFFKYRLDQIFNLYHEFRPLLKPDSQEKSLPDFEIIPKNPQEHGYTGCIIELTTKRLDTPKKKRQRRVGLYWQRQNPNYFYLEFTKEILENYPETVELIAQIFSKKLSPESFRGRIEALLHHR